MVYNLKTAFIKFSVIMIILSTLNACSRIFGDRLVLTKVTYSKLTGWQSDDLSQAMLAFKKSCDKYITIPAAKKFHINNASGRYSNWQQVCAKTDAYASDKQFFESNFTPYAVKNWWQSNGIFTGYYESELKGSRIRKYPYIYPVYKAPPDLQAAQKYYTRAEINKGILDGKGLEIAWVDDFVQLFFMQVQGSGRISLDDGSQINVGYAGANGHKYFAIGRYLLAEKYLDKDNISKVSIEKWLKQNPDKLLATLEKNPSYVFFRQLQTNGPIGAQGTELTPMRSLAVDNKFIPYGAPVWLETNIKNASKATDNHVFQKLLIAQDTGSAIKGVVRGDIFFGYGSDAEKMAGYQNDSGRYFILLPNGAI